MASRIRCAALAFLAAWAAPTLADAQAMRPSGLVEAGLLLRQLDGVKRVLMIGAHPDDEDTALLTALSRDLGAETAYLSVTRGDGGQNLIGPELWEGLGVIRTGELEAARELDGGLQFFTRAFDFGYSKTADEALTLWPHDEVLADVVWVVRSFRPHVIVAVWTGTDRDGHGQHTAAGILTREAYEAAGDPSRFPEQLAHVEPWQPAKLYQSARRDVDEATVVFAAGRLDPLLGRSTYQLAMASRSQHRSQDMGAAQPMGPRRTGAYLEDSRVQAEPGSMFSGIDTTLVGTADGVPAAARPAVRRHLEQYRDAVARARGGFGLDRAALSAPLLEAAAHLRAARDAAGDAVRVEFEQVTARRLELVTAAWMAAAGVVVDARADDDLVVPGQEVEVEVTLWNGGDVSLAAVDPALAIPPGWSARQTSVEGAGPDGSVAAGDLGRWTVAVRVPDDAELSRLYFLEEPRDGAMYRWGAADRHAWGLPRDPAPVAAMVAFGARTAGVETRLAAEVPWRYVGVDQARGEFVRPVLVVPEVAVRVTPEALVWPEARTEAATLAVSVTGHAPQGRDGRVAVEAPPGWTVAPAAVPLALGGEGAERTVSFRVRPSGAVPAGEQVFRAVFTAEDGERFAETASLVDYDHIERAVLFRPAEARFTVVPVRVAEGLRVGYVMGTGDDGPEALRQMGADVTLLGPDAVVEGDFDGFDVLVLGVRAYEVREDVRAANAQILDFARRGGTVVLQYNQYQFARGDFAPYPVDISRPHDRVADETAEVRILQPEAPVFTTPNRIGPSDFDGWVQERGLYFLGEWDDRYVPLLELNDPGEDPKRGALVVAPVGEGLYVYTGLSFFRQWSSGVPGAYRLFANLVSLEPGAWRRFSPDR